MSIARRIAELYEVKMNAVLDRAADPREMVDYSYVQLQELLSEVRRGTAGMAAARRRAELRITADQPAAGRRRRDDLRRTPAGRRAWRAARSRLRRGGARTALLGR
jgi:phage shock protein A